MHKYEKTSAVQKVHTGIQMLRLYLLRFYHHALHLGYIHDEIRGLVQGL